MIGSMEAGIMETIDFILKLFSPDDQLILANNVFLTGSCSKFPGLKERLSRELTEIRPFQSTHRVNIAQDSSWDAWQGASNFAQSQNLNEVSITRDYYQEVGGDYLKEHYASNVFYPTPTTKLSEPMN